MEITAAARPGVLQKIEQGKLSGYASGETKSSIGLPTLCRIRSIRQVLGKKRKKRVVALRYF